MLLGHHWTMHYSTFLSTLNPSQLQVIQQLLYPALFFLIRLCFLGKSGEPTPFRRFTKRWADQHNGFSLRFSVRVSWADLFLFNALVIERRPKFGLAGVSGRDSRQLGRRLQIILRLFIARGQRRVGIPQLLREKLPDDLCWWFWSWFLVCCSAVNFHFLRTLTDFWLRAVHNDSDCRDIFQRSRFFLLDSVVVLRLHVFFLFRWLFNAIIHLFQVQFF